jgi:hypothetical protein
MLRFGRRFCGLVLITAYWLCALWLLFRVFPMSADGGGASPTFYRGTHAPTPTLEHSNRLPFLCPYWCAAFIITLAGCAVIPWLVRLRRPRRPYVVLVVSAATLVSLLLVGAGSDIGVALHIWLGPTMYAGPSYVWPFLKVMVPMSLLAGVLALARSLLDARGSSPQPRPRGATGTAAAVRKGPLWRPRP